MKKLVTLVLCLMMLLTSIALAEGMGVQIINSPEQQIVEPVSMDDIKLGKEITVEGYGIITPETCEWTDAIYYANYDYYSSGNEADYLLLTVRILNTQYTEASFIQNCQVAAEYGDGYVFGGWRKQYQGSESSKVYYDNKKEYNIQPLYAGKYAFIVTLPNFVKDSKEPLSITVTLSEDVELTYHVRK